MADPTEDYSSIEYYNRRLTSMKSDRSTWDTEWVDLNKMFYTRSSAWLTTKETNKGGRRNRIIDATAVFSRTTLEAGMTAGLTSPSRPWWRNTTPDPELMEFAPVSRWLYTIEQVMRDILAKSNFYSVIQPQYGCWGTYGTLSMLAMEDAEKVIRFVPDAIGSYYLAANDRGLIDTRYKELRFTTRQMVLKFGEKNVSKQVKLAYDNKRYDEYWDVVHVLEPSNNDGDFSVKSCWYEKSEQKLLLESGFDETPLIAARWRLDEPDDIWGTPPALIALGAAKALQHQQKQKAKAIDKHVDPPMVGDPALKTEPHSLLPGDITWAGFTPNGSAPRFQPLYTLKPEIGPLNEDILDIRQQIKEAMFTNVFLMLTGDARSQPPTAEEIRAREGERMLMMGPVVENGKSEIFEPTLTRLFNICVKRSRPIWEGRLDGRPLFPPPPKELDGVDLKLELISVLAQAQKAVALQGIERFGMFVANAAMAQANAGQAPTALDKVDMDQSIDEYALALGVPPTIVNSDEMVAAIRSDRAAAQAQAQKAAQAEQASKAIAQTAGAAKDLSETEMGGGGSALDQLTGQAA